MATAPLTTEAGLPTITLAQARLDADETAAEVSHALWLVRNRLDAAAGAWRPGYLPGTREAQQAQACELVAKAQASLDWLADRLAIAEGGPLGRVPRSGDDTPANP